MIGGEAANRIFKEVLRGVISSESDTAEQRAYREEIIVSVRKIRQSGAGVDIQKEWM